MPDSLRQKLSNRLARHVPVGLLALRGGGPIVSFTFDDAPPSAAEAGAASLEMRGLRGTYYLCGGLLGGPGDFQPLMSRTQAANLAKRGHEIACHTFTHQDVRTLNETALRRELVANAKALAELSGRGAPRNFAYPFGWISLAAKLRVRARFDSCRSTLSGLNSGAFDRGLLKAVALIDRDETRRWIAAAVRRKAWLIFFTHDVRETPTAYGVTPDLLDFAIDSALEASCACLPVDQALLRVRRIC
jgi:peptidoglycan/xylan/chitin deacetylase (PgdA/CDA1 family)